jgi:WD40 repeat protein/serine/threonine protein kinase
MEKQELKDIGREIQKALREKDWPAGAGLLEMWCRHMPSDAKGWYYRAYCLAKTGRLLEAERCAEKSLTLKSDEEGTRELLSYLKKRLERGDGRTSDRAEKSQEVATLAGRPEKDEVLPTRSQTLIAGPDGQQAPSPDASSRGTIPIPEMTGAPPASDKSGLTENAAVKGPAEWKAGDVLMGLYEVSGILGEGGFGKVYKVRHRGWNIDLAVKSPRPEALISAGGVDDFKREAETWVGLGLHPHIVSCYYVRDVDGLPRVFAEYVSAGSLKDWIRDRKLTGLESILDTAIQFTWGLKYAHDQGLIHQDVKPANVMMTHDSTAKVTDFGLARARGAGKKGGSDSEESLLVAGGGYTPAYASPEQANGEKLSPKTDLWSFGLSVLEMFTGGVTWHIGSAASEILENYLKTGRAEESLPTMPSALAELLQQCFRKNPGDRPKDFDEVAEKLQKIYQEVVGRPFPRKAPKAADALADSLNNRAISLLDLGRQEEAERYWEDALKANGQHPESIYNQGLVLWRPGRMTDAALLERLREAASSRQDQRVSQYLTALIHLERNDCEAALRTLENLDAPGMLRDEIRTALELAKERLAGSHRLLHVLKGHTASVNAIALSQDGRFLISASNDGSIRRWETGTAKCLKAYIGHSGPVQSVALSADGRLAASGGKDGTVRIWDIETGQCQRILGMLKEESSAGVTAVDITAHGEYVIAGGSELLNAWDVAKGQRLPPFDREAFVSQYALGFVITSVCIGRDGRYAISGGNDPMARVWDMKTGRCLHKLNGHRGFDLAVCCGQDGRYALSGSNDKRLILWDLETNKPLRFFTGHMEAVHSVSLSQDGRYALSGGKDCTVRLWSVSSGRCLCTFEGHRGNVWSVALSPDGRMAASAGKDGEIRLWHLSETADWYKAPMMLSTVRSTEENLSAAAIYGEALQEARAALEKADPIAAAASLRRARSQPGYEHGEEAVELWTRLYRLLPKTTLKGGWQSVLFQGHDQEVKSACLSEDGRYVLSGGWEGRPRLWDAKSGKCIRTFTADVREAPIWSVALSRDGTYALAGGNNQMIHCWETATGRLVKTFRGHESFIVSIFLSEDEKLMLSGGGNPTGSGETMRLWDFDTGRCIRTFRGHTWDVHSVALSLDGRLALSGSKDKTVRLWETGTGRLLKTLEGHRDTVLSVCLTRDGRYALSGSADRTIRLWDLEGGQCVQTFVGHGDQVHAVVVSQDGKHVLSGSSDKTLRVWERATAQCLRVMEGHTHYVVSAYLSQDACRVLSASFDHTVRLWILDWELADQRSSDEKLPDQKDLMESRGPGRPSNSPSECSQMSQRLKASTGELEALLPSLLSAVPKQVSTDLRAMAEGAIRQCRVMAEWMITGQDDRGSPLSPFQCGFGLFCSVKGLDLLLTENSWPVPQRVMQVILDIVGMGRRLTGDPRSPETKDFLAGRLDEAAMRLDSIFQYPEKPFPSSPLDFRKGLASLVESVRIAVKYLQAGKGDVGLPITPQEVGQLLLRIVAETRGDKPITKLFMDAFPTKYMDILSWIIKVGYVAHLLNEPMTGNLSRDTEGERTGPRFPQNNSHHAHPQKAEASRGPVSPRPVTCPNCGAKNQNGSECSGCGMIFARYQPSKMLLLCAKKLEGIASSLRPAPNRPIDMKVFLPVVARLWREVAQCLERGCDESGKAMPGSKAGVFLLNNGISLESLLAGTDEPWTPRLKGLLLEVKRMSRYLIPDPCDHDTVEIMAEMISEQGRVLELIFKQPESPFPVLSPPVDIGSLLNLVPFVIQNNSKQLIDLNGSDGPQTGPLTQLGQELVKFCSGFQSPQFSLIFLQSYKSRFMEISGAFGTLKAIGIVLSGFEP